MNGGRSNNLERQVRLCQELRGVVWSLTSHSCLWGKPSRDGPQPCEWSTLGRAALCCKALLGSELSHRGCGRAVLCWVVSIATEVMDKSISDLVCKEEVCLFLHPPMASQWPEIPHSGDCNRDPKAFGVSRKTIQAVTADCMRSHGVPAREGGTFCTGSAGSLSSRMTHPASLLSLTTQAAKRRPSLGPRGKMASPIICKPHLQAQHFLPGGAAPSRSSISPSAPGHISCLAFS